MLDGTIIAIELALRGAAALLPQLASLGDSKVEIEEAIEKARSAVAKIRVRPAGSALDAYLEEITSSPPDPLSTAQIAAARKGALRKALAHPSIAAAIASAALEPDEREAVIAATSPR